MSVKFNNINNIHSLGKRKITKNTRYCLYIAPDIFTLKLHTQITQTENNQIRFK